MLGPCSGCALSLRKANGSRGVMLRPRMNVTPTFGHCPLQCQPCWDPPAETWHMVEASEGYQRDLKETCKSLCGDFAASAPQHVVSLSTSLRGDLSMEPELFCMGRKAIAPPASWCCRAVLGPQPVPKYLRRKEDPARLPIFRTSFSETTVGGVGIAEEGLQLAPCPEAGPLHPMASPFSWHQLA